MYPFTFSDVEENSIKDRIFNNNIALVSYTAPDPYPFNPRDEWDYMGSMVCFGKYIDFTDHHQENKFNDPQDFFETLASDDPEWNKKYDEYMETNHISKDDWIQYNNEKANKHYIILPLYLYDHSGMTIRTFPFTCSWDSGQVGYIYMSRSQAKKFWSNSSSDGEQEAISCLKAEVNEFDAYLRGDVRIVATETFFDGRMPGDTEPQWVHISPKNRIHILETCSPYFSKEQALEARDKEFEYYTIYLGTQFETSDEKPLEFLVCDECYTYLRDNSFACMNVFSALFGYSEVDAETRYWEIIRAEEAITGLKYYFVGFNEYNNEMFSIKPCELCGSKSHGKRICAEYKKE